MSTTAYLFTIGLTALMACSSGSSPAPTGSTTSDEVCSPTLGPIAPDAGAGQPCGAGATCAPAGNGSYACAATSPGGW
jgi:hypothetical protein